MSFFKHLIKNAENVGKSLIQAGDHLIDKASPKAEELFEKAKSSVNDVVEKVSPKAEALYEKAKDSVNDVVEKVAPKAEELLENAKAKASQIGQSVNNLAEQIQSDPGEEVSESAPGEECGQPEFQFEPNESLVEGWDEKLPGFPKWRFGGNRFEIDENYTSDSGTVFYFLKAYGASEDDLNAYVALLKIDGFRQRYEGSDEVFFKDLGEEYLVFSERDALSDPDVVIVGLYRTRDETEF